MTGFKSGIEAGRAAGVALRRTRYSKVRSREEPAQRLDPATGRLEDSIVTFDRARNELLPGTAKQAGGGAERSEAEGRCERRTASAAGWTTTALPPASCAVLVRTAPPSRSLRSRATSPTESGRSSAQLAHMVPERVVHGAVERRWAIDRATGKLLPGTAEQAGGGAERSEAEGRCNRRTATATGLPKQPPPRAPGERVARGGVVAVE